MGVFALSEKIRLEKGHFFLGVTVYLIAIDPRTPKSMSDENRNRGKHASVSANLTELAQISPINSPQTLADWHEGFIRNHRKLSVGVAASGDCPTIPGKTNLTLTADFSESNGHGGIT
jgi:hypothetical protein